MSRTSPRDNYRSKPFSGYFKHEVPAEDSEITRSDRGTPLGEYMRRSWQPVCFWSCHGLVRDT